MKLDHEVKLIMQNITLAWSHTLQSGQISFYWLCCHPFAHHMLACLNAIITTLQVLCIFIQRLQRTERREHTPFFCASANVAFDFLLKPFWKQIQSWGLRSQFDNKWPHLSNMFAIDVLNIQSSVLWKGNMLWLIAYVKVSVSPLQLFLWGLPPQL